MTRDMALDADHSTAIANGGTLADRLLHASCNRSRKAGRPNVTCDYHHDCGTIHSRAW